MSVNGKVDSAHMRQVGLSYAELKIIGLLAQNGGEFLWKPEYAQNEAEQRAYIAKLEAKQLITRDQRDNRTYIRLTDQGRSVAAQLEAMMIAPKVEVVQG